MLQSDRGITYAGEVPAGSRVVEGEWWGADYNGPPLVSFEKKLADGLGLKIGDTITVNVLGRNIDRDHRQSARGRLAEPRHQFRPGVFARRLRRRAAHPYRDADLAGGDTVRRDAAHRSTPSRRPSRPSPRCGVKDALEAVGAVVTNLVLGDPRRELGDADRRRCWCSAARWRPATAIGSMTPSSSRRSARPAAA